MDILVTNAVNNLAKYLDDRSKIIGFGEEPVPSGYVGLSAVLGMREYFNEDLGAVSGVPGSVYSDGSFVAVNNENQLSYYNARGEKVRTVSPNAGTIRNTVVHEGFAVYILTAGGNIRKYPDRLNGSLLLSISATGYSPASDTALALNKANGHLYTIGRTSGWFRKYDSTTGALVDSAVQFPQGGYTILVNPAGTAYYIAFMNGQVKRYSVSNDEETHSYTLPDQITNIQLVYEPQLNLVVAGSQTGISCLSNTLVPVWNQPSMGRAPVFSSDGFVYCFDASYVLRKIRIGNGDIVWAIQNIAWTLPTRMHVANSRLYIFTNKYARCMALDAEIKEFKMHHEQ